MGARRTSTGSTVSRWLTTNWSISRTRFVPDGGEGSFGIYSGLHQRRLATHAEVSHARTAPPHTPHHKAHGRPSQGAESRDHANREDLWEGVHHADGRRHAAGSRGGDLD